MNRREIISALLLTPLAVLVKKIPSFHRKEQDALPEWFPYLPSDQSSFVLETVRKHGMQFAFTAFDDGIKGMDWDQAIAACKVREADPRWVAGMKLYHRRQRENFGKMERQNKATRETRGYV